MEDKTDTLKQTVFYNFYKQIHKKMLAVSKSKWKFGTRLNLVNNTPNTSSLVPNKQNYVHRSTRSGCRYFRTG